MINAQKIKGFCGGLTAMSSAAGDRRLSCLATTPIVHPGLQIAPHPRSAAANT
jgi:hypothetical protein